jgi:thiol-disulfide isomerase/thioredoxin
MFELLWIRLGITFLILLLGGIWYRYYWHSLPSQLNLQTSDSANKPTILFFSAPDCVTCHAVQAPALAILAAKVNDKINIIEIDTSVQPEMAKKWKILSVPTLIILDANGELAHVKHGAQSAPALLTDIQPLS